MVILGSTLMPVRLHAFRRLLWSGWLVWFVGWLLDLVAVASRPHTLLNFGASTMPCGSITYFTDAPASNSA